jgi:hypothetical protein
MVGWLLSTYLGRIWEEAAVALFQVLYGHMLIDSDYNHKISEW